MAEDRDPFESTRMSLGEHLAELRKRLFRGVLALLIAFCVGWAYYDPFTTILLQPLKYAIDRVQADQLEKYEAKLLENPATPRTEYFITGDPGDKRLRPELTVESRPIVTGIGEGFWFSLRVAIVFAMIVGGPVLLWQMWQFIAAGLYKHERRIVLSYFPASLLLFIAGVLFGYFWLLPYGMYFMAKAYDPEKVGAMFSLAEYWGFFITMTLALGGIFQLPVVMFALVHIDLVARETFRRFRPHFCVFAFVFGGIVTPPDPWSQFLVALPMVGLYEIGLLATWPVARRRQRERERAG